MGFNAGAAAGQTVNHLHIHVIPRRHGDVEDPRGGVRHVIPALGNYQQTHATSTLPMLIDARQSRSLRLELIQCLRADAFDRIDLLVSFIMKSGLNAVAQILEDAIGRGAHVRILTTDYMRVTDADALARLLDLTEASAELEGSLDVRVFSDPLTSFHPKAYLFWSSRGDVARGFVGSNNLSYSGIESGIEWSLAVNSVSPLVKGFEDLWNDRRSAALNHETLRAYRDLWTPHAGEAVAVGIPTEAATVAPTPSAIQQEAMAALVRTRTNGHQAGLVVMATGLGKTWLAAFDSATFDTVGDGDVTTRFARTLFVAHREEILRQSRDVFRVVRPGADLGLFHGDEKQPDAEVVFASIQTLSRRLHEFAPDAFDYVVIDEFHHAAANSYRALIDHFQPKFLLGLTATPERMDAADLMALCGDNLVFDCGLVEGIDRSALVPFHYWGIKDVANFEHIPWRNGRFDTELLTNAVATEARAQQSIDEWRTKCGERTIGFCVSVTHADFIAEFFRQRDVVAVSVHSGPSSADRRQAVDDLRTGVTQVLFAVDVFNEGVDIPEIDSVMMLRPTESPVIFLQQLGRGLRNSDGKTHLQVVDFVGNHQSFLLKPRVLLSLGATTTPTHRQVSEALATGEFDLPAGCSVDFELEVIDLLRRLAAPSTRSGIEEFCLDYAREMGIRATAAQTSRSGYNPVAGRAKHQHWFGLQSALGLLTDAEAEVVANYSVVVTAIEKEPLNKSYKLVTMRALLAEGALRTGATIADVSTRARRFMLADPRLVADVTSESIPNPAELSDRQWESFWVRNPLQHMSASLFRIEGDRFVPSFSIDPALGETFDAMVAELVEWRLADHLLRRAPSATGVVRCKLSHASGRPIIFLDRLANPGLPEGDTPLMVNGEHFVAKFVKIAVNVVHRVGDESNELPALLRGWFGPSAGHPGTNHAVLLELVDGHWVMRAEGEAGEGELLPFYPSFAVACGAFGDGAQAPVVSDTIALIASGGSGELDPAAVFVAVSRGDSMSGGPDPIHHGDHVLLRWARGVGRSDLEGERVLVQMTPADGASAVLKVLRRSTSGVSGSGWVLSSTDPDVPDIDGTSSMSVVATLVRRLEQSEVSPVAQFIGERFKREQVPGLLGAVYNSGNWQSGQCH